MTEKTLAEKYPYVSYWVQENHINIGPDYHSGKGTCASATDAHGVACEKCGFENLEEILDFLEAGIKKWEEDFS